VTDPAPRRWVLLHGFTGGPAVWDGVRAALVPHGAVLCPAIVGHAGRGSASAAAAPATDFVSEVDRLAALIAAAGFAASHLCGYSLGGRLALGLLVRHPGLFSRATLIGAHPGLPEHGDERQRRDDDDERWAVLAERAPAEFFARWAAQPLFASQRATSPEAFAAQQSLRAAHDGAGLAAAMRALSLARMPDWHPFLSRLAMPVRLVAGGLDTKFVALAREMARRIPQAALTIVPGVGHNVVLEEPAAIVAALLDQGHG